MENDDAINELRLCQANQLNQKTGATFQQSLSRNGDWK
jgi:hypothetical protein